MYPVHGPRYQDLHDGWSLLRWFNRLSRDLIRLWLNRDGCTCGLCGPVIQARVATGDGWERCTPRVRHDLQERNVV
jgi:hypothetical protein